MRKYPTCLLGYVEGPVRFEALGGQDIYFPRYTNLLVFQEPAQGYAITHLQKKSRFGFLLMWPFCLHIYFTFKFQEQRIDGTWIPGTEKVFYARTPGFRWDAGDSKFILTKGYIGLHWDQMTKPSTDYRDQRVLRLRQKYEAKDVAVMMGLTINQVNNARRRLNDRRKKPRPYSKDRRSDK